MDTAATTRLQKLARLYGVETAYYDLYGKYQTASPEALLAVLRVLGAPVATIDDVPAAIREYQQAAWRQPLEPVAVTWDGNAPTLELRLPAEAAEATLAGYLKLENGDLMTLVWPRADLPVLEAEAVEGRRYVVKQLSLPAGLPYGYHRFTLDLPGRTDQSLIIAAPSKAYCPPDKGRRWGVFLPLYALHHDKGWCGNFADMAAFMNWAAGMGAGAVGTLPLLATFLDKSFEPSPYSPASRLLWNEFYLDITGIPEYLDCPEAQAIMASPQFLSEIDALRQSPLVNYRHQMALKRQVLEELCRYLFAGSSGRLASLQRFAAANPMVEDYARFRAAGERQHFPWPQWPAPLRDGTLKAGDYDETAKRYHLYVQWLTHEQIESLAGKSRQQDVELYLDLPLGVHPYSYDIWRQRGIFALEVSGGAPPDDFFVKGQNWGTPPLHPEQIRRHGYEYMSACLHHLMQCASILRIDHVMQFHRLFWIPKGMEAKQGVYVNYQPDEFYAILSLESHRHKSLIVGEDLGTVPPEVREAMSRHALQRMYVLQFEIRPDPQNALATVPVTRVASLNTHDTPTFAGFWQGLDILDRKELGLLNEEGARKETERRQSLKKALVSYLGLAEEADLSSVLKAVLAFLSASQAGIVLVNLEDLWLETQRQNTPGTWLERPNWRRKARHSFDAFRQLPAVFDVLREIDHIRKGGTSSIDVGRS